MSIETAGSLRPGTINTPLDQRSRVNSLADISAIELPFLGQIVFCVETGKYYKITKLKSKLIGAFTVENAAVDTYEAIPVTTEEIEELFLKGADGTISFGDLTPEQIESLKGDTGPRGPQGPQGDAGPEVKIEYSPDGKTWGSSAEGSKYIRFSTDNGSTWSTPVLFVGESSGSGGSTGDTTIGYNKVAVSASGNLLTLPDTSIPVLVEIAGKVYPVTDMRHENGNFLIPTANILAAHNQEYYGAYTVWMAGGAKGDPGEQGPPGVMESFDGEIYTNAPGLDISDTTADAVSYTFGLYDSKNKNIGHILVMQRGTVTRFALHTDDGVDSSNYAEVGLEKVRNSDGTYTVRTYAYPALDTTADDNQIATTAWVQQLLRTTLGE